MEPFDPIGQLTRCCFGRRNRCPGDFKTQAIRNQYYYSPSMAHIGAGNTTTWPGPISAAGPFAQGPALGFMAGQTVPAQPYIMFTQPLIINSQDVATAQQQQQQQQLASALAQQAKFPTGQLQAVPYVGSQLSPLHKVPSLIAGPSQYAIYSNSMSSAVAAPASLSSATIYECPQLMRNRINYLGPIAELSSPPQQQQQQLLQLQWPDPTASNQRPPRPTSLNSEVYRRLELIEKQVDLTRDMDLVERHGVVITRAIEPLSLAPHLTEEILNRYREQILLSNEHVIRFIEIIKRPGQTLGLYIRLVHFEHQLNKVSREGIVITKIESNSPVYTSQVLHVGDEIISINLIAVQSMSLDDVVTLMSIPKRLVLALRAPKGRDPQLRATYALNQNHMPQAQQPRQPQTQPLVANGSVGGPDVRLSNAQLGPREGHGQQAGRGEEEEAEFQYAQRARLAARQQFDSPLAMRTHESSGEMARLSFLGQHSASHLNFTSLAIEPAPHLQHNFTNHRAAALQEPRSRSPGAQPMRPMRAQSAIHMSNLNERPMSIPEGRGFTPRMGDDRQAFSPSRLTTAMNNAGDSRYDLGTPPATTRLGASMIGRQMATAQSLDEPARDESDRFRNFSVDTEIASLEREAMNKERHTMHVLDNHRIAFGAGVCNEMDPTASNQSDRLFPQMSQQGSSTLPRRTLPARPDLISSTSPPPPADASSSRRPLLGSIRLGETPEQSSYFSSSIDAINRELKELRRQRMALGNNEASLNDGTGDGDNAPS